MNDGTFNKIIETSMKWFRTGDYSEMDDDLKKEMMDLVNDDGTRPSKDIRLLIATNLSMIARAYDDEPLARLQLETLLADDKKEVREILGKIKNILNEPKFKD